MAAFDELSRNSPTAGLHDIIEEASRSHGYKNGFYEAIRILVGSNQLEFRTSPMDAIDDSRERWLFKRRN